MSHASLALFARLFAPSPFFPPFPRLSVFTSHTYRKESAISALSLSLSRARARARVLRRRCERVHSMREKKSDLGSIFLLSLSFGIRVSAHLYFFIQIRVAIASLSPLPPRIYPA